MKKIKEKSKGVIKKQKMTRLIRLSVLFLSITGLFSILYLCYGLYNITNQYTNMTRRDYLTTETLQTLEEQLYQHQSYIFEHVVSNSPEFQDSLEKQTSGLKSSMSSILYALKDEMKDTKFDIRYKSLSSNIFGYLYDAESIFEMSHNGESEKANIYMEESLMDYINTVNSDLKSFDNMIHEDMKEARTELENNTKKVLIHAVLLFIILLCCAGTGIVISIMISNEMTNFDPVTGIPNYDKFIDVCEKKHMRKTFSEYAVLSINIKGFQYFNQQHGTDFGDEILTEYASFLRKATNTGEIAARINGDTFIALIKKDRVPVIADYIKQITLNIHRKDGTRKVVVNSRCGIYETAGNIDVSTALDYSETALKEAKNSTNSDCIWYSETMTESEIAAKETIAKFKDAIKNEEFSVYYQPKVNMIDDKLCGCEALVRWIKDGQTIPPFKFIPVLESEGYITELDMYVFEHVCQHISKWKVQGIEPVRISSNFSKLHLKNKRFADDVLEIIEKYGIEKKYIEIELTESSGYEDFDAMTEFVNRMKSEKIYTAIDDFGTGYSSLSMLKDLDIDVVKLDKSFLSGAEDKAHKKMIENVVRMINDLQRKVICEGVETRQQAEFLKSVECYLAQGYLYDKPLPHDEFEQRLLNPSYKIK